MVRTGDYSLGKIYKLVSNETDKVYIGSTCQRLLSSRFSGHKTNYKSWLDGNFPYVSSFDILAFDDAQIVLVENFPCQDKYELEARERYYIENNNCVNKHTPTRSKKEWTEINWEHVQKQQKEWRENNHEHKLEYCKKYYQCNREEFLAKCKIYRDTHKEQKRERDKRYKETHREHIQQYLEKNKERINGFKKEQLVCDFCGGSISRSGIARHKKTKTSQSYMKNR